MNSMDLQSAASFCKGAADLFGQDASLRLIRTFLIIGRAGESGVEQATIERETESAQSTASRNIKLLVTELQLAENFLDQSDGRRRLVRLTKAGRSAATKLLGPIK